MDISNYRTIYQESTTDYRLQIKKSDEYRNHSIPVKLESLVIMGNVSTLEETSECCELLGSQKWCTGPCFQDRRFHQPFLRYPVRDIQRIPKGGSEN
jgi:hypothetical protein